MLTAEKLQDLPSNEIFAHGKIKIPHPMKKGKTEVIWVAMKVAVMDWYIAYGSPCDGVENVRMYGARFTDEATIRKLVPCDDIAYGFYKN